MAFYKRDLDPKQLQTVEILTSLADIMMHMEQLEKERTLSQSDRLSNGVKSITDCLLRVIRFCSSIYILLFYAYFIL